MADRDFAKDYIQVNERIAAFKAVYPDGSLQSEIITYSDNLVVMKAYAYRNSEDARPGIGHSSLAIPGATPYTRGSELENAETSAYGRALAALGFEVKRSVASADEIRSKHRPLGGAKPVPKRPGYRRQELAELASQHQLDLDALNRYADRAGIEKGTEATDEQIDTMIRLVTEDTVLPEMPL